MNLILEMIAISILAALYGLAWHNQPARQPDSGRRTNATPERHE